MFWMELFFFLAIMIPAITILISIIFFTVVYFKNNRKDPLIFDGIKYKYVSGDHYIYIYKGFKQIGCAVRSGIYSDEQAVRYELREMQIENKNEN